MTRRGDKQNEWAFYVPEGNCGEVWVIQPDEGDLWGLALFINEQIAKQYAEWLQKCYNLAFPPHAHMMKISNRMRKVD